MATISETIKACLNDTDSLTRFVESRAGLIIAQIKPDYVPNFCDAVKELKRPSANLAFLFKKWRRDQTVSADQEKQIGAALDDIITLRTVLFKAAASKPEWLDDVFFRYFSLHASIITTAQNIREHRQQEVRIDQQAAKADQKVMTTHLKRWEQFGREQEQMATETIYLAECYDQLQESATGWSPLTRAKLTPELAKLQTAMQRLHDERMEVMAKERQAREEAEFALAEQLNTLHAQWKDHVQLDKQDQNGFEHQVSQLLHALFADFLSSGEDIRAAQSMELTDQISQNQTQYANARQASLASIKATQAAATRRFHDFIASCMQSRDAMEAMQEDICQMMLQAFQSFLESKPQKQLTMQPITTPAKASAQPTTLKTAPVSGNASDSKTATANAATPPTMEALNQQKERLERELTRLEAGLRVKMRQLTNRQESLRETIKQKLREQAATQKKTQERHTHYQELGQGINHALSGEENANAHFPSMLTTPESQNEALSALWKAHQSLDSEKKQIAREAKAARMALEKQKAQIDKMLREQEASRRAKNIQQRSELEKLQAIRSQRKQPATSAHSH